MAQDPDGLRQSVKAAAAPEAEALSEYYSLTVGEVDVPVYACRVSAMPFNQVWPGYQRPLDQTEMAGFAYWEMADDQPVNVEVVSERTVESVVVRPSSLGIEPEVDGDRVRFTLDTPRQVVVEVNGPAHALHLFADPPAPESVLDGDAPGLHYFGPGVHRPGKIVLQSGERVHIAAGAVVYGSVHATGATGIAVTGNGILDVSPYPRGEGGGAIRFTDCTGITVRGIIMRDPDVWCCSLFGCRDAVIENVKLVGLWRYNADGIDICNSENVVVRNSFVRAFDDAIVLKGLRWDGGFHERPVRDVAVRGCTLWCDWGRALELGAETSAPEFSAIRFEDCDIIRTTHIAMDIQHGDRALIHDVRFSDIRVEMDPPNPQPRMQHDPEHQYDPGDPETYLPTLLVLVIRSNPYSKDSGRGQIRDIVFRNISVRAPAMPPSSFQGLDADHTVEGVLIEGLRLNGLTVDNPTDARLSLGEHVGQVEIRP